MCIFSNVPILFTAAAAFRFSSLRCSLCVFTAAAAAAHAVRLPIELLVNEIFARL